LVGPRRFERLTTPRVRSVTRTLQVMSLSL